MGEAEFLMRLVTMYDFELSLQIGYSVIFLDCSGHLNLFSDHEGCAPQNNKQWVSEVPIKNRHLEVIQGPSYEPLIW